MKNTFIFASGLGNKLIFIESLIEKFKIIEKEKLLKKILKKNLLQDIPFKIFKLTFIRLLILAIKANFKNKFYFVIGLHLTEKKLKVLNKISGKKLKFFQYPKHIINGKNKISKSEIDFYRELIKNEKEFNEIIYFIKNNLLDNQIDKNECSNLNKYTQKKYISIHLGSHYRNKEKRPNIEIISNSIKNIKNKEELIFLLVGSYEDYKGSEKLIKLLNKNNEITLINMIGKTNIYQLIDIVNSSRFLISGDSGVRQLADFLEINNIGIFGPTSEIKNLIFPIKHKRIILRGKMCKGYFYNSCDCPKIYDNLECILSVSEKMLSNAIERFI